MKSDINIPLTENINTQGVNIISHTATNAVIDIAILNSVFCSDEVSYDLVTELTTFDLSFSDFISCFYSSPGGNFVINPLNNNFRPLSLVSQNYITSDGIVFYWNLYNQSLKAYSNKHNISETLISPNKKILLTKETFNNTSLATNCGSQNVLSWDQVLLGLETTRQIKYTNDMDDQASVIFRINYVFHSKTLDIKLLGIFSYRSTIPGYSNIYGNEDLCIPFYYNKKEMQKEEMTIDSYFLSSSKKRDPEIKTKFKEITIDINTNGESLCTPEIQIDNDDYEEYEEGDEDEDFMKNVKF